MKKTILIRLEGTILIDEYLDFKYYEKLWYYLRRAATWQSFDSIIELREQFLKKGQVQKPYQTIANRYLNNRDRERYFQEIDIFTKKFLSFYLRIVPGILTITQNLNYYYKTVLLASNNQLLEIVLKKFWLQKYFNHLLTMEGEKQESLLSDFFQKALLATKTEVDEAILISSLLGSDVASANHLGISTIQTKFDLKTKGIMPQNLVERKYFQSVQKIPEFPTEPVRSDQIPMAVAESPVDILKLVKDIEKEQVPSTGKVKLESDIKIDFWDLMKQLLNQPIEEKV
jgi:FMN phosphatase YigB (HAD superfamily)